MEERVPLAVPAPSGTPDPEARHGIARVERGCGEPGVGGARSGVTGVDGSS